MSPLRKLMLLITPLLAFLAGCQEERLSDPVTQPAVTTVKAESGHLVTRFRLDGMDGHASYLNQELVIDPDYYSSHSLQRGEVVYLNYPDNLVEQYPTIGKTNILRVIALEGETVEIRKSVVYINGNKLEAFYGRPPGPGLEELKDQDRASALPDNDQNNLRLRIRNYESMNLASTRIPAGSVFLLGDNRGRSADSMSIGAVTLEHIQGKVLGYLHKHEWEVSPTFHVPTPDPADDPNNSLQLRGEQGMLAIVDQPLIARKAYQNFWFFWGQEVALKGKLEIIGVKQGNERNRHTVFAAGGVSEPIKGTADGHIPPSNMTIPEPGLWRLEAYIKDKYFGSIVVDVQANSIETAPWTK